MIQSKAEKVLKEIENAARHMFLPIVGPSKGKILAKLIREFKPKYVLEVGTLIGYSAILMGKELSSGARLITIEMSEEDAKIAKGNIKRAEIPPVVEVLIGDALEIIPKLKEVFDFVFFDADKPQYLNYLLLVEEKLHKGSVVVADNVEQSPDYLNYVKNSGKYVTKYVSAGYEGLEVSIKT